MNAEVRRAWAAWELKRPAEALRQADRALAVDPNDADAHAVRARALERMGRAADALEALARASALAPGWAWPHLLRSDFLEEHGDLEAAMTAADESARLAPRWASAHVARALRLKALNRRAEAIAAADEAVRLDASNAHVLATRGLMVLDIRPGEAESFCRRSLALDPQSAWVLNNLGVALYRLGRSEEATSFYRAALAVDPMLAVARSNLERLMRPVDEPVGKPSEPCDVDTSRARRVTKLWPFVIGYCLAGVLTWVGIVLDDIRVAGAGTVGLFGLLFVRALLGCCAFLAEIRSFSREGSSARSP